MNDFFKKTFQPFKVVACSFLTQQCSNDIEYVYTLYGRCLRYHAHVPSTPVSIFSRQAGLTMAFAYNRSDWTSGWNHFIQGKALQYCKTILYD